tara:strand:- start:25 stop:2634 length:2610 start_codon:yes stop_codon:yes gene_type:complete
MICDARFKTMLRNPNMIMTQVLIPIVMIVLAFGSTSFLKTTPYVVPAPLSLKNLSTSWSSTGNRNCVVDLTGFDEDLTLKTNVHNILSSQGWGKENIRHWKSIKQLEHNVSISLDHPSSSFRNSCGGLIYNTNISNNMSNNGKDVDASKHDYFDRGSILLNTNTSLVPSGPIFLNIYSNGLLSSLLRQQQALAPTLIPSPPLPTITTLSHPLPYHVPQVINTAALFLPMFAGMGFLSSGLGGLAMVADRESHRTVVLRVRGLPPLAYIGGHMLFDVVTLSVPLMAISVVLIYLFDCPWLIGTRLIGYLSISLIGTIGTATLGYASSHCFQTSSMAGRIIPAGLPAVTVIPFVVIFVLKNQNTIHVLSTMFCVCPPFALQEGVKRLMNMPNSGVNGSASPTLLEVFTTLFEPLVLSSAFTTVAMLYVCMKEGVVFCRTTTSEQQTKKTAHQFHSENTLYSSTTNLTPSIDNIRALGNNDSHHNYNYEDNRIELRVEIDDGSANDGNHGSGVKENGEFTINVSRGSSIQSKSYRSVYNLSDRGRTFSDSSTNGIRIQRLVKEFPTRQQGKESKIRAVNGLTLEVRRGELLGFLGPNGAGKSTTMSILSTEIAKTFGHVKVGGFDVSNVDERNAVRSSAILGFCPQFDALYESLSVIEHFILWGKIQGETTQMATSLGTELAKAIGLEKYLHVHSSHLSGGNKRKLSIALALLGSPDVLLLDEPSTGVDVASRRIIWNLLQGFRQNAAVLLSTHSMEEAVAISDRIAIVVKGTVAAQGTVAELQHKYGDGFVLEVATEMTYEDEVADLIVHGPLKGTLKERFDGNFKFVLNPQQVKLADAFETMTSMNGVKYFSLSHATMNDVFMNLLLKTK